MSVTAKYLFLTLIINKKRFLIFKTMYVRLSVETYSNDKLIGLGISNLLFSLCTFVVCVQQYIH